MPENARKVKKAVGMSKQAEDRGTFKQSYYMDVKGRIGRMYITYLEFGLSLLVDGHASPDRPQGPMTLYPAGGFSFEKLSKDMEIYYKGARDYYESGKPIPHQYVMPECVIGIETKQNGNVSLDIFYRFKHVYIIDAHYDGPQAKWFKLNFNYSEKIPWGTKLKKPA